MDTLYLFFAEIVKNSDLKDLVVITYFISRKIQGLIRKK